MAAPDPAPLAGTRVLVTRPAAQAEPLCRLIERAGGTPLRFPTIEIAPPSDRAALERIIDRLEQFQLAIFVSPNAVTHALAAIRSRRGALPAQLAIACVGPGSARALAEFGIDAALTPGRSDSEGLLELPRLQQVGGERIVVFRGEGGRELLAETLRQRGAQVEYAECYRRQRPTVDAGALARDLMQERIDIVTLTSADALRNLYGMLGQVAGARLARVPLVVVSERLRDLAHELGHHGPVKVTAGASDEAIVAAIEALAGARDA
jgi:uroporphyrinogen-III synthase